MIPITSQISMTSIAWPALTPDESAGWITVAVAPMARPIDPSARTTAPIPTRPGTGSRRGRKHYGPLRVTLRVLYNINTIADRNVYIKVGNQTNYWQDNKLFIFDDTLQHKSCNESDEVRYCMFVDILRPSLFLGLMSATLACVRVMIARFNFIFYKHWAFIK